MPIALLFAVVAAGAFAFAIMVFVRKLQDRIFFRRYEVARKLDREARPPRWGERVMNRYFSFVQSWLWLHTTKSDRARWARDAILRRPLVNPELERRRHIAFWLDAASVAVAFLGAAVIMLTVAQLAN